MRVNFSLHNDCKANKAALTKLKTVDMVRGLIGCPHTSSST